MYYAVDKYGEAYNTIVRSCSSHSSCQLVLFVSCLNVDALCAAKILSLLFKKQLIQSQIVPVFGYSELKTHYDQIDDNVNTVMFIGFGGVVDLETFLEIDPEEYITENAKWKKRVSKRYIYVWDAQRPWNLDNLFGSEIVQCFDDGTVDDQLSEVKEAYYKLIQLEKEQDEDQDPDGDDEDDNNEDDVATDQDEDDDDDDDDDDPYSKKRSLSDSTDNNKRKRKMRKQQIHKYESIIDDYYAQGVTVVNSLAAQVYSLLS